MYCKELFKIIKILKYLLARQGGLWNYRQR